MRRVVSLWLPNLSTDRLTRPHAPFAAWRDRPFATLAAAQGGWRLAAATAAARAAGALPGMALADARALRPDLKTAISDPAADMAALSALAEWCGRYTPWTAVDGLAEGGGGGVWLDVSGCAHLFGGERALLDDLVGRIDAFGVAARAGLADTPGAAWAAARFLAGEDGTALVPEGAARQWLSALPVTALRLPPADADTLRRLGLRRISDLLAVPRAPLAARFGAGVARRLDQLLGRLDEPLSPRRPVAAHHARLAFAEPIGRTEDVLAALDRLLAMLCRHLERRRLGARRLEFTLFRVDGTVARAAIGTARAIRDPAHLARLFTEEIDGLDAGFGIEAASLAAAVVEPLSPEQTALAPPSRRGEGAAADLGLLVDRLGQRLGAENVGRRAAHASHVPERAVGAAPAMGPLAAARWPTPPRPLRLLSRPEPVATAPGEPPPAFRWRGDIHRVARADGPERLAAEWWHGAAPPPPGAFRDYWRVEDAAGRRFWLFRDGARGPWFLHGEFG